MRIFSAPNLLESDGPEPLAFEQRMEWSEQWLQQAQSDGNDHLNWLAPHSTYLLGDSHLRRIAELAHTYGAHIHVHASETVGEMKLVANRHHGRTPIQVLADTDLLTDAVLAHGVHLSDEDIELIADHHASVTHCPASNQKLASGTARIIDLHKAGVNVGSRNRRPSFGERHGFMACDATCWIRAEEHISRSNSDARTRCSPHGNHQRRTGIAR